MPLERLSQEFPPTPAANTLPRPFPPPWASAWGDDRYGLWADFEVGDGELVLVQRMRWIEPGQFLMGSRIDEPERQDREGPLHPVAISQGFWLANTACTQGLWQAVLGQNPSHFHSNNGGSPAHPVEKVNWHQVQDFLQVLQQRLPACQASLPTEAEWEYACRAGSTTSFWFGATISPEQANYDGGNSYNGGAVGVSRGKTVAVKEFAPNPWGLYQISGNVWEWCRDEFRTYTADAVQDPGLENLRQPNPDSAHEVLRALRGGSWFNDTHRLRSAYRGRVVPVWRDLYTGFRLALRSSRPASGF